jgi:5-methylcytosine-specific restriction endonuclease McrA
MLLYLAEVERRQLFAPEGYPSMFAYCVEALHFSEGIACKRLRAARAAQKFPVIFAMITDGRLHLSGAALLRDHLTPETADELLAAVAFKSRRQIEELLAARFPRPDVPSLVRALGQACGVESPAPGRVNCADTGSEAPTLLPAPGRVNCADTGPETPTLLPAPGRVEGPHPRVALLAPERYAVQFTMDQAMRDDLTRAQELLGFRTPIADVAEVLRLALREYVVKLEKRKYAAPDQSCKADAPKFPTGRGYVAAVKRAVRARDGGRCTHVAANGRRCNARHGLEFDHIQPVARGGLFTFENLRLRCRAHNQLEAERVFGEGFMHEKRDRARRSAAERRPATRAGAAAATAPQAAEGAKPASATSPAPATNVAGSVSADLDVTPWLRHLGIRAEAARRAAKHCESLPDAPLEERVRAALSFLAPRVRYHEAPRSPSTRAPLAADAPAKVFSARSSISPVCPPWEPPVVSGAAP